MQIRSRLTALLVAALALVTLSVPSATAVPDEPDQAALDRAAVCDNGAMPYLLNPYTNRPFEHRGRCRAHFFVEGNQAMWLSQAALTVEAVPAESSGDNYTVRVDATRLHYNVGVFFIWLDDFGRQDTLLLTVSNALGQVNNVKLTGKCSEPNQVYARDKRGRESTIVDISQNTYCDSL